MVNALEFWDSHSDPLDAALHWLTLQPRVAIICIYAILRIQPPTLAGRVDFHVFGTPLMRITSPGQEDRPGTHDDETWRYDTCLNGAGRLCRIETGNGEYVAFEYNAFGQVTKTGTPAGNTQYAWTASAGISRLTLPSGRAVLYDYNAAGQVTRVRLEQPSGAASVIADQLTHAPFGPVTGWRFGNGLLHTRSVDQQYWPREIATAGVASQSITHYDGNGNPTGMTVDTQSQLFGYSAQDRLETAVGPWGDHGYLFDAVGNRLSQVQDGNTTNYQYTPYSNRLDSDTGYDWTLDATGNTTEKRAADGGGMSACAMRSISLKRGTRR